MNLATDRAPKFSKVELIVKKGASLNSEVFQDCGLILTGDYIIVVEESRTSDISSLATKGIIFNLSEISSYQTIK